MRYLVVLLPWLFLVSAAGPQNVEEEAERGWNISATASSIVDWADDLVLANRLDMSTRVLSVREDGCFIDAGSQDGVAVGQVFEIYRTPHGGGSNEIAGNVQVAWTREDYSFAQPLGGLDISTITELHFARLVHVPPTLALISDTAEAGDAELDQLLQALSNLLSLRRNIRPVLGEVSEPAWRLEIAPDAEGKTLRVTLSDPGGEISGSTLVNPLTGERPPAQYYLDPSYVDGTATPFAHSIAPPGRRGVCIASGNIVPGSADELAILDGSDLWVYDLAGAEPRLLSSLRVSTPPGQVHHREDTGSLELIDLNGDGQVEVCLAPPGAARGEVWQLHGDSWLLLEFLPWPARAVDPRTGGVVVAPYLSDAPALDPSAIQWVFPTTETEPASLVTGFPVLDIAPLTQTGARSQQLLAVDTGGTVHLLGGRGESQVLPGKWGNRLRVAMYAEGPVAILTSAGVTGDKISLINPLTQALLAQFPVPQGPIIDLALGDIDRDGRAEILSAVLEKEGVRIYY